MLEPDRSLRTGGSTQGLRLAGGLLALLLAAHSRPAIAQFKLQQSFTGTSAPGWTLTGNAYLTAPSIDQPGQGWLRLTDAVNYQKGLALDTAQSFAGNVPVTVRFSYVSWGGNGADGITLFLYDSTQDMSGAQTGGGLGYCGGAGGYLAVGLDEYGNFSNPGDRCGAAGGGPGRQPDSLVIRGPLSANDQYVTGTPIAGGIDNPGVSSRPSPKTVLVTLTPAAVGYTVTAQFQSASGQPFQTLFANVAFPFAAPVSLSVGFSGSTGGSTNTHELQGLVAATPDDLQVTMSGPATVLEGTPVTYSLTVTNNGAYPIGAADAPFVSDSLPASISGVSWTCAGSGGASCTASGSGNLSTTGLNLPSNASVNYTITGTLDPSTPCGGTLTNTATADFGSTSTFLDPDETNNTPSVSSNISCAVTVLANPGTVTYGPTTVGTPSASRSVVVTGTNGLLISKITTTGDYSQTNDCGAALNGTSCTIVVTFNPGSEGTLNGTLVITSSAATSPTTVALSGTGTNAIPDSFTFTPLNKVGLSTVVVSNPITVTGTNVPTTISISSGAAYSVNGGAYTSTPGVVAPGARITVRLTSPSVYGATVTATLTIGGVSSKFIVTAMPLPPPPPPPQLQNTSVTSGGGGGVSPVTLIALLLLLLLRLGRSRLNATAALLIVLIALASRNVTAADWDAIRPNLYFGGAFGGVTSSLTPSKITGRLQEIGYQVQATNVEVGSMSASLYVGYELPRQFAVEAGWSYLGRTTTELAGVAPPDLDQLLADAARVTRGGGDAWSLVGRYRWAVKPKVSVDFRAGPYRWVTHSDLRFGSDVQLSRNDRGWGYVLSVGPRYELSEHWAVALNANYFVSTSDNHLGQYTASIDYRLR
jgi:Bacterial lectin/OmpA-like transmembrane domain